MFWKEKRQKYYLRMTTLRFEATVSTVLEMFGHIVKTVADGRDVIEVIDDSYDVIILDINMPDMGGFETIKVLNSRQYDIPVLFLTGAGSMEYVVQAINLGGL